MSKRGAGSRSSATAAAGHFAKAIAVQRPLMMSHAISVDAARASPLDISVPRRAP